MPLPCILERDDENAEAPPQKSCRTMATQVQQSQSRNEAGNIPELFAKHKPDVCQNAQPILLTLTSLFHLLISPSFHLFAQNLPFKSFLLPSSKTHTFILHVCARPPPHPSPFLPTLRLWCWQIRSLRAAYSSALMREPVTRSTASISTSWAFYSTPLKRTGP